MSERDELVVRLRAQRDHADDWRTDLAELAADLLERDGARAAAAENELDAARAENARLISCYMADLHRNAMKRQASAALTMRAESQPELIESERAANARLTEELDAARAALAEAQKDAERYRLMRRDPTVDGESLVVVEVLEFNEDGPTDVYYAYAGDPLDAVIDAAIAKEQSHASE